MFSRGQFLCFYPCYSNEHNTATETHCRSADKISISGGKIAAVYQLSERFAYREKYNIALGKRDQRPRNARDRNVTEVGCVMFL